MADNTQQNNERVRINNSVQDYKVSLVTFDEIESETINLLADKVSELTVRYSYDKFYNEGYMIYQDTIGVFNFLQRIPDLLWLKVEIIDCTNFRYTCYYKITNYKRTSQNELMIVHLEFIDEFSYFTNVIYNSVAYSQKSSYDIIKESVDALTKAKIIKSGKFSNVTCTSESDFDKKDLLQPGNKTLYRWLNERSYIDDFCLLNRRTGLKVERTNNLWVNAEEIKITLASNLNIEGPFNFQSYTLKSQELEYLTLQRVNYYSINHSENNNIAFKHNSLINSAASFGDSNISPQLYTEYSFGTTPKLGNSKIYNQKMLEAQHIMLEVKVGSFMYEIGTKVNVYIPSTIQQMQGQSMIGMSGQYFVAAVQDSIVNGFFSQKIALIRPGVKGEVVNK